MPDQTTLNPTSPPRGKPTKTAAVEKLLRRAKGATLTDIGTATDWQPHSVRAFFSRLRKKGSSVVREVRPDGETAWRIER